MTTPVITYDKGTATADGVDTITVSGVPVGSNISLAFPASEEVLYAEENVTDTQIMMTFTEAGEYELSIRVPPYVSDEGSDIDKGMFYFILEAT